MALRRGDLDDRHAASARNGNDLAILELGDTGDELHRQLLGRTHRVVGLVLKIVRLGVVDHVVERFHVFERVAQLGRGIALNLHGQFSEAVHAPLGKQLGVLAVEILDGVGIGLGRAGHDTLEVGPGEDLALGVLDGGHDLGVAVELGLLGFLDEQLLVDQALEHLLAGRLGLGLGGVVEARQGGVHLMDRDFVFVDLGCHLGGLLGLTAAAAAGRQCQGGDGRDGENDRTGDSHGDPS